MAYTPRLTEPSTTDKRWINTAYGGYNRCINVGGGSVIPNCTGYVHGRWMEIGNTNTDYNLSLGNANTYYSHADGFERGQEPKLGAIAVYTGGEAGHVCVVEEIISNDEIVCSESDYGGARFSVRHRYRQYGWRQGNYGTGGFAGFIYHPSISDSGGGEVTPPSSDQEYNITVKNGTASKTKGKEGEIITLTANKPNVNQIFKGWKATAGKLENPYKLQTSYTIAGSDATITAEYSSVNPFIFTTNTFVYHKNKY